MSLDLPEATAIYRKFRKFGCRKRDFQPSGAVKRELEKQWNSHVIIRWSIASHTPHPSPPYNKTHRICIDLENGPSRGKKNGNPEKTGKLSCLEVADQYDNLRTHNSSKVELFSRTPIAHDDAQTSPGYKNTPTWALYSTKNEESICSISISWFECVSHYRPTLIRKNLIPWESMKNNKKITASMWTSIPVDATTVGYVSTCNWRIVDRTIFIRSVTKSATANVPTTNQKSLSKPEVA